MKIRRSLRILLISFLAFLAAVWADGCKKSGDDIVGDDNSADHRAPAAVLDLTITNLTVSGMRLEWTAPGDDGDSGRASAYDLRFSHSPITSDNWNTAQGIPLASAPKAAGAVESIAVTGLTTDSSYYFGIKTVDEAGNWSILSNCPWGVCFDNFEVTMADSSLEDLLRFYLGKPDSALRRFDLLTLTTLNAPGRHIGTLSGLEYCKRLQSFNLWNNAVHDFTPLLGLTQLTELRIGYNGITDIGLLASMTQIKVLHLNANSIEDITALTNLNGLEELNLTANRIWILTPLSGKANLKRLYLDGNQIVFVNALYNLSGIEKLDLSRNQITDVSLLLYNSGLGAGDSLWLTDNPLGASSIDTVLPQLEARGVTIIQ
ncbi:MAG: leucine-rich repeat domain-containing protein [Candidatus Zixiibacteriota bacterium]